ncbi:sulfatase family protein [Clostridium sp.]
MVGTKTNSRPNILFLMTDEQRFDTFSNVNSEVKTPCIGELIKNSVFFKNAYCSNPSCIPSRAAILTGKYPTQCICPTYITKLPKNEKTFVSMMRENGYHTAVIGKQHFADSEIVKGFDEEMIYDGHGPFADDKHSKIYQDFLKESGVDKKSLYEGGLISGGTWRGDIKYHIDTFTGELGKKWIKEHEGDKPWFLTVSFSGPHQPFDCEGTEFAEQYNLDELSLPKTSYEDLKNKPPHYKRMKEKNFIKNYSQEIYKKTKRSYYANISLIDKKIGEIIEALKLKGEYDNTLIVYTADHGDFMGDFGMITKAQYLSQGLMRVPLFAKPPIKDFEGYEVLDNVLNIDIAATCLGVAGGKVEKDMSDYSYEGYWNKEAELKVRDYIYYEASNIKASIKDGFKLIHYMDRPYGELYNLNKDPLEVNNLWDDEAYLKQKLINSRLIIDQLIKMTPLWDIKWNVDAPEI